eukprot:scaffold8366_cov121-Isochrysis_galbana.AAC.2
MRHPPPLHECSCMLVPSLALGVRHRHPPSNASNADRPRADVYRGPDRMGFIPVSMLEGNEYAPPLPPRDLLGLPPPPLSTGRRVR